MAFTNMDADAFMMAHMGVDGGVEKCEGAIVAAGATFFLVREAAPYAKYSIFSSSHKHLTIPRPPNVAN